MGHAGEEESRASKRERKVVILRVIVVNVPKMRAHMFSRASGTGVCTVPT